MSVESEDVSRVEQREGRERERKGERVCGRSNEREKKE